VIDAGAAFTTSESDGREGGVERYRGRRELGAVGRPAPGSRRCASSGASRGRVAPEIVGALEAQGLHPAEQISLCWLHRRRAGSDAGRCDQVSAAVRVPRGRDRRAAGAASPTADAAKRRCAGRDDAAARFFPVRRLRNLFLLSAHGHESNYACARGREGNEAFIVGDYRGEYWR
jgi:hypothetical protein